MTKNTNVDTIENLQSIVNNIKKNSAYTKIAISPLFIHKGVKGLDKKVSDLNIKLKEFCQNNLVDYLPHENINESCLSTKKLHLSKKGTAIFTCNLKEYISNFF